ncbi:hypothetical protein L1887_08976 [Cichorium endivia]|nr:hypothetical protein L1887_08976 [Cichorium endivia]
MSFLAFLSIWFIFLAFLSRFVSHITVKASGSVGCCSPSYTHSSSPGAVFWLQDLSSLMALVWCHALSVAVLVGCPIPLPTTRRNRGIRQRESMYLVLTGITKQKLDGGAIGSQQGRRLPASIG